jgi:hypothetical protein
MALIPLVHILATVIGGLGFALAGEPAAGIRW